MKRTLTTIGIILLVFVQYTFAQDNLPRLSPKSYTGQSIGYTNTQITYGSPGVKGRTVWGELVPYGKVWRTGANEATTIEFDKAVIIDGKIIPAGKYSLFSIPEKKSWTIIFNKVYDQWGAYKYDENKDVIRFNVKPTENNFVERLSFSIEFTSPYKSNIIFEWEKLKISFTVNSKIKE